MLTITGAVLARREQYQEVLTMKIRPLHDRVIIRRMEEERTSPGGFVIPDSATEKPIKG